MSELHQLLKKYWGYGEFRPLQLDIIEHVLKGNDTLALLPTGGGKSICYQLPGLYKEGTCIVISPLIALIKDQLDQLQKRNIPAKGVYSGMTSREIDIALDNCIYGDVKFLYISPERIQNELFIERLKKMNVSLIAVDEAHCISQWGYDFRPAYLNIAEIRNFTAAPILAVTATATEEVVKDIREKLNLKAAQVFSKSFFRKNLSYSVFNTQDKMGKLVEILTKVKGSAIVYTNTRRKTKEIAEQLIQKGFPASYFHAGLQTADRFRRQEQWIKNQQRIMVCTNAFGMGIDKPDVRAVIHIDIPETPEAYFQEAGRAGRDERKAYAVMLYNAADIEESKHRFDLKFPDVQVIKNIYHHLGNYYQLALGSGENLTVDFQMADFIKRFDVNPLNLESALKILQNEGLIYLSESISQPSRVKVTVDNEELYHFQVKNPYYDGIIKLLLRSYEGLFSTYRNINEKELAHRGMLEQDNLIKGLQFLHAQSLIDYIPQTNLPQLTFLRPRLDAKTLSFSQSLLSQRKKILEKKLIAMHQYCEDISLCRNLWLCGYFNEENAEKCGICDICQHRHEEVTYTKENELPHIIKSLLSKETKNIKELVLHIEGYNSEYITREVRRMLETGEVQQDENGSLSIRL